MWTIEEIGRRAVEIVDGSGKTVVRFEPAFQVDREVAQLIVDRVNAHA